MLQINESGILPGSLIFTEQGVAMLSSVLRSQTAILKKFYRTAIIFLKIFCNFVIT